MEKRFERKKVRERESQLEGGGVPAIIKPPPPSPLSPMPPPPTSHPPTYAYPPPPSTYAFPSPPLLPPMRSALQAQWEVRTIIHTSFN